MSGPVNRRVSILSGASAGPDSPFKRRSILNMSGAMPPPDVPELSNRSSLEVNETNDDEAERRNSRRFEINQSIQSTTESVNSLAEHADSLNNCLKLFSENKINKENAWNLNIIDHFAKLIQKHHHLLSNFQVAGTTLEASTKVYGLRVDSVYTDVLRMSADLARQSAKALTKRGNRQVDEEDQNEVDRDESVADNENNPNATNTQQPKKKPRARRVTSTITKNPDTLNGRLDTIPLTDPFFAKLNSVIGDTNSSKRLMQNIIPTEDSKLILRQNMPIWTVNGQQNLNLEQKVAYKDQENLRSIQIKLKGFQSKKITNLQLRQDLSNYKVTNEPMEQEDDQEPDSQFAFGDEGNNTAIFNASNHVELQFDINAEVEPVPVENSVMMDFGDMDQDDFEDLNEMDQIAVNRCKGLIRQAIVIDDMQPETSANLDYSYRRLDMIDQFWAGPSHWKFRQSRRTAAMSMGLQSNNASSVPSNSINPRNSRAPRKKKTIRQVDVTLEDLRNIDEEIAGATFKITARGKGTTVSSQTILRKWDPKKHKLPDDFKVPLDTFDKYLQATTIRINSNPDITFTGNDDDAAPYDYNNDTDRNYCVADVQSDTETETNTDIGQMDNHAEFDNVDLPPLAPVDEIPDVFEGAPERIEKISIAFAKRAKVVDMKHLKACSWSLIKRQHQLDPEHNPKFSNVLKELPKLLSRTMAENMSMPLAFYASLHLCNDKSLLLNHTDEILRDFEIQFVEEETSIAKL